MTARVADEDDGRRMQQQSVANSGQQLPAAAAVASGAGCSPLPPLHAPRLCISYDTRPQGVTMWHPMAPQAPTEVPGSNSEPQLSHVFSA